VVEEVAEAVVANVTNASVAVWELSKDEIMEKFRVAGEEAEPGLMLAYFMLLLMAIGPIYFGSKASVLTDDEKQEAKDNGVEQEIMTNSDAAMFPVFASCALFGLYCLFKVFGKEYVNFLMGGYFFLLGVLSLTTVLRSFVEPLCPPFFLDRPFDITFKRQGAPPAEGGEEANADAVAVAETETDAKDVEEIWFGLKFDLVDVACFALASVVGAWYLFTKHWVATNMFGLSFAYNGIALFSLGSFQTGCILLTGLFFYDVFWVFGTDVMVTVARSFDAPIKVLWPKDFMVNGIYATEFAMLGLGDIVLPGVLIALLLRFDVKNGHTSEPYFRAAYIAYILGLVTTIVIMHTFKAAQPALLYLVPFCLLTPLALSVIRGETALLFAYDEAEEEEADAVEAIEEKKDN